MATRFYLRATAETVGISPAADAAWEDTSILARCVLRTAKSSDAMTTVAFADADSTDKDVVFRQYVSEELAVGQTITGSQALKAQCRVVETDSANRMFLTFGVRVINTTGPTVNKTVLVVTRDAVEAATTLTNRQFTATSAATNYTTVAGDRIVVEIGSGGDPDLTKSHSSSLRLGDADAADLPENDTDTTDKNPWIEFTDTWTFGVASRHFAYCGQVAVG